MLVVSSMMGSVVGSKELVVVLTIMGTGSFVVDSYTMLFFGGSGIEVVSSTRGVLSSVVSEDVGSLVEVEGYGNKMVK